MQNQHSLETERLELIDALKLNSYGLAARIEHDLKNSQMRQNSTIFKEIPIDFFGGTRVDLVYKANAYLDEALRPGQRTEGVQFHFCIEVKYSPEPWLITKRKKIQKCFNTKVGFFLKDDYCLPICNFFEKFGPDSDTEALPVSSNLFIGKRKGKFLELARDEGHLFQVLKQHYAYAWAQSSFKTNYPTIVVPILITNAPIYEFDLKPEIVNEDGSINKDQIDTLNTIEGGWVESDFFLSGIDIPLSQRHFVEEKIKIVYDSQKSENPDTFRPITELIYVMRARNLKNSFDNIIIELSKMMPAHICRRCS
jgi:hypothetical protein